MRRKAGFDIFSLVRKKGQMTGIRGVPSQNEQARKVPTATRTSIWRLEAVANV